MVHESIKRQEVAAKKIAAFIKKLRKKYKLSLRAATEETLVSGNAVRYWEEVDCNPTLKNLNDYLDQYGYELRICKIENNGTKTS